MAGQVSVVLIIATLVLIWDADFCLNEPCTRDWDATELWLSAELLFIVAGIASLIWAGALRRQT